MFFLMEAFFYLIQNGKNHTFNNNFKMFNDKASFPPER
jgi:hypothetical protein